MSDLNNIQDATKVLLNTLPMEGISYTHASERRVFAYYPADDDMELDISFSADWQIAKVKFIVEGGEHTYTEVYRLTNNQYEYVC